MPRRSAAYLIVALACVAVGALVYAIAVGTRWGAELDSVVLGGFTGLERPWLDTPAAALVRLVDPWPYALLGAALATVALARSRPRHALVVAGVLGGAALTSQLLKPLLAASRPFDPRRLTLPRRLATSRRPFACAGPVTWLLPLPFVPNRNDRQ